MGFTDGIGRGRLEFLFQGAEKRTEDVHHKTLGGGDGATPNGPGCDGVHTHMTNTRITDPEVLELRYPVRLNGFALRPQTGGAGRHRGGDGLLRRYTLLAPLSVTLLADRRLRAPFGLHGGHDGARGETRVDGVLQPSRFELEAAAGTQIEVRTPGGGGYGAPAGTPKTSGSDA